MRLTALFATALALFTIPQALNARPSQESSAPASAPQLDDLTALAGEWIYVEDRTAGHTLEELGPPMASQFSMAIEEGGGAVIVNGHGSGHGKVPIALDGSTTDIAEPTTISHYSGSWKDGTFEYQVDFERVPAGAPQSLSAIRRSFRMTTDGLLVTVMSNPPDGETRVAIYRHAEDIELPTPAKARIGDLSWLAGAWAGTKSTGSAIEEHWIPPAGGAMLAVSRTVNTSGKMVAFEFLRIVELDGGLVYKAQPGGAKATEFVLTELVTEAGVTRAVFENPRHDYPKRIAYELSADGALTATAGFLKGGTPQRFEFKRQAEGK